MPRGRTTHGRPQGAAFTPSEVLARLERTMDQCFSMPELLARLDRGTPLRIKYGVDATAPFMHLGHAVNLWMMRALQDAGHRVVFLLGDFTTRIGDPTGKSQTRPLLSQEDIDRNAAAFLEQVGQVLDTRPEVFEVRRNSEWYSRMPLDELLGLLSRVTHAHLIGRDMFQARIADEHPIYMHEMVYPILQGYDSVQLEADLTIVGSDQLFNEMMGRDLQERAGQKPQVVMTSQITPGTDGREKQSKSLGNFIALTDTPRDKYGKVMSIPDALVDRYLVVYTDRPLEQVEASRADMSPMDRKRLLAEAVVERYHGSDVAGEEAEWFRATFSAGTVPEDTPTITVPAGATVLDVLQRVRPGDSRSRLRQILAEGGVRIQGERITDPEAVIGEDVTVKVGKRTWAHLRIDDREERTGARHLMAGTSRLPYLI